MIEFLKSPAFMTVAGTVLVALIAAYINRSGQKESKEQNREAHNLAERDSRWDQLTETLTYQRTLIEDLKKDLAESKGRLLRYMNYVKSLRNLVRKHEEWDQKARQEHPDLGCPPDLRGNPEDDPYFDQQPSENGN